MKHLSIKVTGFVQGVGFRYSTVQLATDVGVTGTVKK
jgi:Acylphosphatases